MRARAALSLRRDDRKMRARPIREATLRRGVVVPRMELQYSGQVAEWWCIDGVWHGGYVEFIGPCACGGGSRNHQLLLLSLSGSFPRHGGKSTLPVSPGARCLDLVREVRVRLLPSVPGTVHVLRPGTVLQVPGPMSDLVRRPGRTQVSPAAARGRLQLSAVRIDESRFLLCAALTFLIPSARHGERLYSEGENSRGPR